MNILGIETSCDETAAAVVSEGRWIRSNVVWSQVATHHVYGGVVPELASRKHIEKIVAVVQEALTKAHMGLTDLDGVAVTCGPGLVGALLVGVSFAKAFAYARKLPLVGVDHLQGHLVSVRLEPNPPPYPFVALLASGGHTNVEFVFSPTRSERMGQTRDDAAGEAFDKVAKVMGLGYPGGGVIEALAQKGDPAKLKFPRALMDNGNFDFSFSGIKTAVARFIKGQVTKRQVIKRQGVDVSVRFEDVAAGFQEAVVDVLVHKAIRAAEVKGCRHLAVVGGVAANGRLRQRIQEEASRNGVQVYIPGLALCSDNAAMIAAVGYHKSLQKEHARLDLDAYSKSGRS